MSSLHISLRLWRGGGGAAGRGESPADLRLMKASFQALLRPVGGRDVRLLAGHHCRAESVVLLLVTNRLVDCSHTL